MPKLDANSLYPKSDINKYPYPYHTLLGYLQSSVRIHLGLTGNENSGHFVPFWPLQSPVRDANLSAGLMRK